mgnify:CR=1 FL=1
MKKSFADRYPNWSASSVTAKKSPVTPVTPETSYVPVRKDWQQVEEAKEVNLILDETVGKDGQVETPAGKIFVGIRILMKSGECWFWSANHRTWSSRPEGPIKYVAPGVPEKGTPPAIPVGNDSAFLRMYGHCPIVGTLLNERDHLLSLRQEKKANRQSIQAQRESVGLKRKQRVPKYLQVKH